jgi:hypothetical protein
MKYEAKGIYSELAQEWCVPGDPSENATTYQHVFDRSFRTKTGDVRSLTLNKSN